MKIETRLLLVFVVRLVFLFFAGWVALVPDTIPGAHILVRIGLASTFLVMSILVGEVAKLQAQFEMLLRALRSAGAKVGGTAVERDDNAAIVILIRALGSRETSTREKAHANLQRITGQDIPLDQSAWTAWWESQRPAEEE